MRLGNICKGDIVVLSYPFTDLTNTKSRPALVVHSADDDDVILCAISSRKQDQHCVALSHADLRVQSFIRLNKIFTADKKLIGYKVGEIRKEKMKEVMAGLVNIITKP